jgi:hypothetical protein
MDEEKRTEVERYPGNSNAYNKVPQRRPGEIKAPDKKPAERVTKGHVVQKKKSLGAKFKETFLAVDLKDVFAHIVTDVIAPTIKETLEDIIRSSTSMLLWPEGSRGRSGRRGDRRVVPYDRYYDDRGRSRNGDDRDPARPKPQNQVEDLVFDRKPDAEDVLDSMIDRIAEYNVVSVRDLYAFAGMPRNYAQDTYGWFNLEDAEILHVREGWMLKLPRPVKIDE